MIHPTDYSDKKIPWSIKPNIPLLKTSRTPWFKATFQHRRTLKQLPDISLVNTIFDLSSKHNILITPVIITITKPFNIYDNRIGKSRNT